MNVHVLHPDAAPENDLSHRVAMDVHTLASTANDLMMLVVNSPEGRRVLAGEVDEIMRVVLRLQLVASAVQS